MRIRWYEHKLQTILKERKIDFADLEGLLYQPYVQDQSLSYRDQYRIIGFERGRLVTEALAERGAEPDGDQLREKRLARLKTACRGSGPDRPSI